MTSDNSYCLVFDTSTLISAAILPKSIPKLALELAIDNCTLCASEETLFELKDVLNRSHLDRYEIPELRAKFFKLYSASVKVISVTENVTDCRDEKDDKFLSLALAAQAQLIISSDNDLLTLNPYRGISIIKPKDFLELMKKQKTTVQ